MTSKTEKSPDTDLTTTAWWLQCHLWEVTAPGGTVKWEIPD